MHANWTPFLIELADAYVAWKARASMNPSSPSEALPSDISGNMSTLNPSSPSDAFPSDISGNMSMPQPSSPSSSGSFPDTFTSYDFNIATIDIYTLQRNCNIHRSSDMKTAVALMNHGLL